MNPSNFSNSTEAAKSGLNLTLEPIEEFVFKGLQQKISRVFETQTVWVTANDKVKTLQRMFGSENQEGNDVKVKYPYTFLTLGSVTESVDRGNTRASAMRGLSNVVPSTDGKRTFRVQYIPTDFSVSIEFVTNNFAQVKSFANRWLFAKKLGWFNFNVSYGRGSFSVSVSPEGSVQIPQREAELDTPAEYTVQASLTIGGYISLSTLVEQQVTNSLEIDFTLPQENTVVWSYVTPNHSNNPPDYQANTTSTER